SLALRRVRISRRGARTSRSRVAQLREPLQVMVGRAEERVDDGETLEIVTDIELIGHSHAAMDLHRLLPDKAPRLADLRLRGRSGTRALGIAFAESERDHQRDGNGLLVVHEHVDHPMLQRLELADRYAELLAVLGIFDSRVHKNFHGAAGLGAG